MTISQELDNLVNSIEVIPPDRRYWLIRTDGGRFYEQFKEQNIVALAHDEVLIGTLIAAYERNPSNRIAILNDIKKFLEMNWTVRKIEYTPNSLGLAASQIFKFFFEITSGDVVIIPSNNSNFISFGHFIDDEVFDLRKSKNSFALCRNVQWYKEIKRVDLDYQFSKIFTTHQAIYDVSSYAVVIERSLKDLFILNDEAHIIMNILKREDIPAKHLFGIGNLLIEMVDEFAKLHNLEDVNSEDLIVSINLNSKGKADLKSKIQKTTILAGLLLASVGGGYQSPGGHSLKTDGIPGLIKAVNNFMDAAENREMRREIFEKYKDSLQVKTPSDMIDLVKQFDSNKDLPK